ncbi:MAG: helix-turn-helix transcriptional regulator [Alphaproteobacteria bacterium]|jgi:transcriptional regulator with XRE-family HTH domain|nr:helix-turn-helix transcriptional regulator [Alphaproteobacteria bacterium]
MLMSKFPNPSDFAAFLREAIRASGLTATALADKAGVNQSTISRVVANPEYGGSMRPATLQKIAIAAGLPLPDVLAQYVENWERVMSEHDRVMDRSRTYDRALEPVRDQERFVRDAASLGRGVRQAAHQLTRIPVFPLYPGGPTGSRMGTKPADWVGEESFFEKYEGAIGVYVSNERMVPKYNPGDLVIFHPVKPAIRNEHVLVVYKSQSSSEHKDVVLGKYIGSTVESVSISFYNFESILHIETKLIEEIQPVLCSFEGWRIV